MAYPPRRHVYRDVGMSNRSVLTTAATLARSETDRALATRPVPRPGAPFADYSAAASRSMMVTFAVPPPSQMVSSP